MVCVTLHGLRAEAQRLRKTYFSKLIAMLQTSSEKSLAPCEDVDSFRPSHLILDSSLTSVKVMTKSFL